MYTYYGTTEVGFSDQIINGVLTLERPLDLGFAV